MKQFIAKLAAIYPVSWLQSLAHGNVQSFANTATPPTEGVHEWTVTRLAASAFNARRLPYNDGAGGDNTTAANRGPKLVKTSNGVATDAASGWNYVAPVAAISDVPMGVVDDSPAAIGDEVTVQLLGRGPTKLIFAEEAIAVGDKLCSGASGGVRKYGTGGASGSFFIGLCVGSPANQVGDVVEVNDCGAIYTGTVVA